MFIHPLFFRATCLLLATAVIATVAEAEEDVVGDGGVPKLLVQYTNDECLSVLQQYDVDNEIDMNIEAFKLASITVNVDAEDITLDSVSNIIKGTNGCSQVVTDYIRQISLPNQTMYAEDTDTTSTELNENDNNNDQRHLRESVEYGISLVQADQLYGLADEIPNIDNKPNINICVIDTGIQNGHDDLPNSYQHGVTGTDTYRLEALGTWDADKEGHGTHCAGVIGAIGDNGQGVVGIRKNPETYLFHIGKGLSDYGGGRTSNIIQALVGCRDAGAKVISMSLGGPYFSPIEEYVYNYMYENEDLLIIAAAGNDGNNEESYPASYKSVVSVAAVDSKERRADFSQYNKQVELSGPGVNVYSTFPENTYKKLSGTSMATPHVAGVAAEVWSHFPTCTNNQIRNVLIKTAKDVGDDGYDVFYGHGIVQAKAAYDLINMYGCGAGGNDVDDTMTYEGGCEQGGLYTKQNCTDIPGAATMSSFRSLSLYIILSLSSGILGLFVIM